MAYASAPGARPRPGRGLKAEGPGLVEAEGTAGAGKKMRRGTRGGGLWRTGGLFVVFSEGFVFLGLCCCLEGSAEGRVCGKELSRAWGQASVQGPSRVGLCGPC